MKSIFGRFVEVIIADIVCKNYEKKFAKILLCMEIQINLIEILFKAANINNS